MISDSYPSTKTFKSLRKNSLFKKLNLFYCKEHILVNSKSYDYLKLNNPKISENKIVLLDLMFNNPEFIEMGSVPKPKIVKKFYNKINELLKLLEKNYKKKVVICLHPKDDLNIKKKIFNKFKVVKYATQKNISLSLSWFYFLTQLQLWMLFFLKKKLSFYNPSLMYKNSVNIGG